MPRPHPEPTINSSVDVLQYANTVTDGWMSILFIMGCALIAFALFKARNYRTSDSIMAACAITLVLGTLLWAAGALAGKVLVIFLVFLILGVIYSFFED